MGMQNFDVFEKITASSEKTGRDAEYGLINSPEDDSQEERSWSPTNEDENPFIEVSYKTPVKISSILTKGGENGEYVPQYMVSFSNSQGEPDEFEFITEEITESTPLGDSITKKVPKLFTGNFDDFEVVENTLVESVTVFAIRVYPKSSEPGTPLSLRLEFHGCVSESSTTSKPVIYETTREVVIVTTVPEEITGNFCRVSMTKCMVMLRCYLTEL